MSLMDEAMQSEGPPCEAHGDPWCKVCGTVRVCECGHGDNAHNWSYLDATPCEFAECECDDFREDLAAASPEVPRE